MAFITIIKALMLFTLLYGLWATCSAIVQEAEKEMRENHQP